MIPAEQLVPGDIVFLESGDKIPADIRLIDVKNLRTEEAALTGESVPSDKSTAPVSAKATVGDRASMAYSGTLVVSGRATGMVVATASQTELGRINQLLAGVSALETPLLLQIKKFGYAITIIILIISAITFAYRAFRSSDIPFVEMFQAVTGIAVSMIPEGLPALITITLAIGVQRMAARNAIVRRLPAVETLGSVARICSDKTGTLTLMEMMVVSAATAGDTLKVTGDGYANEGEVLKDGAPVGKDPVLELLGRVSALCNDAELRNEDGVWKVEGDPTEGALYPFAAKLGMNRAEGAGRLSAHRRHPVRIRTPVHGDLAQDARKAARSCSSRARPRRSSTIAIGSRTLLARSRSIAPISSRPRTFSLRKASACWRSRGCPIPASRPGASARPICRRISFCWASSASSIRRARKRSRR